MPGISAAACAVPIADRLAPAQLRDPRVGVAEVVARRAAGRRRSRSKHEQRDAVDDQERRRGLRRGEQLAQRMLEQRGR